MPTRRDTATTERGSGRTGSLTRERIADTALELIDREGVEALSMRRLAGELGVGTMTIYTYFTGKEELLDEAIDRAAQRYELSPPSGEWRSQLRALISTVWHWVSEHPSAVQIRTHKPILTPATLRAGEAAMGILREAGLGVDQAAVAWRLLFTYVFGYAAFSAEEPSPSLKSEWRAQLSALPQDEYPFMSREAGTLAGWMAGREPFEAGLELILDGIEAQLGSAPPARS